MNQDCLGVDKDIECHHFSEPLAPRSIHDQIITRTDQDNPIVDYYTNLDSNKHVKEEILEEIKKEFDVLAK